ncbi:SH3 domain-containing protein [Candidatus Protochlamydia naegleriophila]|uniref:SH3 domain-containing protein n=1 Tax=Candidatus Protochlamydia naegleriophila TaxID=389348 RepID=A0A0U5JBR3_9BACT|nr:SH3 domain-containing protein [Candidatus Protochlamydia naegleriophila]CUI17481.1 SH3 domain-containing protein [Candidatus Protochlamydia naegleriophila]
MMRKAPPSLLTVLSLLLPLSSLTAEGKAEAPAIHSTSPAEKVAPKASSYDAFTGKITKNKVRLRLQPAYDGHVLREFQRNDMVVVLGETEDFYAIQPPADAKGYVFRTYILDNIVEGTRVNVRLKPDLDAPVIAQLNSGDHVEGVISPSNNKWLEIKIPSSTRYYIAKEYIEKIGDAGLMARQEKRKEDVYSLLSNTESISRLEMAKPFDQINLDGVKSNYQHIIHDYTDFPEAAAKAKELLASLQDAYIAKKLVFLESQAQRSSTVLEAKNKQLVEELHAHKTKLATLEQKIEKDKKETTVTNSTPALVQPVKKPTQLPVNMSIWLPAEERLFAEWVEQTGKNNPNMFYEEQMKNAFILKGIVDPYTRPVKNKPGDYMLINSSSKLPIAFLYSTQVNLQDFIGHEVSIRVAPRPNNNYAFPAYFVLSLE